MIFMAKVSETVNVMKKNFMALHNAGYTIPEIADKYGLSRPTVYRHLDEIAQENNVTRSSLLQVVKCPYTERVIREEEQRTKLDMNQLRNGLNEAEKAIQKTIDLINLMLERYNFETEEALFDEIRRIVSNGASDFINGLKKNQKRQDRRCKRANESGTNESDFEEELTEQSSDEEETILESEMGEEAVTEPEVEVEEEVPVQISFEQLLADEQELSTTALELERAHKEKVAQRAELRKKLINAQKAFAELHRILKIQKENVEQLYAEHEELYREMLNINRERSACAEMLELIRAQIAELKKITILVYRTGNIEVENANPPSIFIESFNAKFTELISYPDAEEYTIKELKIIAKVCLMVEQFEKDNEKFEVEFEKTELQSFYEKFTAKPTIE